MTEATVGEADDSSTEIIQPKERKKKEQSLKDLWY